MDGSHQRHIAAIARVERQIYLDVRELLHHVGQRQQRPARVLAQSAAVEDPAEEGDQGLDVGPGPGKDWGVCMCMCMYVLVSIRVYVFQHVMPGRKKESQV